MSGHNRLTRLTNLGVWYLNQDRVCDGRPCSEDSTRSRGRGGSAQAVERAEEGRRAGAGFFAAVDHCASDVADWHVALKGERSGPRPAARLGLAVQGKAVPSRDRMARHPLHARLQWASRSATGSRNTSSGRSRRSASICTPSRPSRHAHDPGPDLREAQQKSGLMFRPVPLSRIPEPVHSENACTIHALCQKLRRTLLSRSSLKCWQPNDK